MRSPTLFCEMFDAQRIKRIAGVLRIWCICYCYSVIGFQVTVCLLWQLMNWDTRWDCHTSKILLLSFTPVTGPTVAHSPLYLEMTRLVSKSSMVRNKLHIWRIKFKKCPNEGGIISLLPGISRRDVEIQPVPDKCDPMVGLNAAHDWRRCHILHEPVKPFYDATVAELFRLSCSWGEVSTQRQVWRTTGATLGQSMVTHMQNINAHVDASYAYAGMLYIFSGKGQLSSLQPCMASLRFNFSLLPWDRYFVVQQSKMHTYARYIRDYGFPIKRQTSRCCCSYQQI